MRKFLLICVVAFGFLYSWAVRAEVGDAETFVTIDKSRDIKTYRVLYREIDHVVVDEYQQRGSDFQQRVAQKKYTSETAAREYLAQFSVAIRADAAMDNGEDMPITELDGEVLWVAENEWDLDWEREYAAWVAENVDANFHIKFGIATDCADVPISLRWIFSRINKLPMANSLAGSRRLFTNETVLRTWERLPTAANWYDDRRFMTALNYVLVNTFTHSLMADSYPIAISPEHFTPGVHHLNLYSQDTGHTRIVGWLNSDFGEVGILESNVPRVLRSLAVEILHDGNGIEKLSSGGFLKIRWAENRMDNWTLRARDQMPGYSMEQYGSEFLDGDAVFFRKILEKLGFQYDLIRQLKNINASLMARLKAREKIVQDGYKFCQANNCAPGSAGHETWSTPHRDQVILRSALFLLRMGRENSETERLLDDFALTIWTIEGRDIRYFELLRRFYDEEVSSDPRDTPRRRWGFN